MRQAWNIVSSLLMALEFSFCKIIGLKLSGPGALSSPNLLTALK